jgi:hypothetical protein
MDFCGNHLPPVDFDSAENFHRGEDIMSRVEAAEAADLVHRGHSPSGNAVLRITTALSAKTAAEPGKGETQKGDPPKRGDKDPCGDEPRHGADGNGGNEHANMFARDRLLGLGDGPHGVQIPGVLFIVAFIAGLSICVFVFLPQVVGWVVLSAGFRTRNPVLLDVVTDARASANATHISGHSSASPKPPTCSWSTAFRAIEDESRRHHTPLRLGDLLSFVCGYLVLVLIVDLFCFLRDVPAKLSKISM